MKQQLPPWVNAGSTAVTFSFQLQMLKSASAAMNMAVMEQCLQIKHTTGKIPDQHMTADQCYYEADGLKSQPVLF